MERENRGRKTSRKGGRESEEIRGIKLQLRAWNNGVKIETRASAPAGLRACYQFKLGLDYVWQCRQRLCPTTKMFIICHNDMNFGSCDEIWSSIRVRWPTRGSWVKGYPAGDDWDQVKTRNKVHWSKLLARQKLAVLTMFIGTQARPVAIRETFSFDLNRGEGQNFCWFWILIDNVKHTWMHWLGRIHV